MKFHLIGGVTSTEAEAALAANGPAWTRCRKRGCDASVSALVVVALFRGPSGLSGDVNGGPICAVHERDVDRMIRGLRNLNCVSVEIPWAPRKSSGLLHLPGLLLFAAVCALSMLAWHALWAH